MDIFVNGKCVDVLSVICNWVDVEWCGCVVVKKLKEEIDWYMFEVVV